jgi:hypothetical protein
MIELPTKIRGRHHCHELQSKVMRELWSYFFTMALSHAWRMRIDRHRCHELQRKAIRELWSCLKMALSQTWGIRMDKHHWHELSMRVCLSSWARASERKNNVVLSVHLKWQFTINSTFEFSSSIYVQIYLSTAIEGWTLFSNTFPIKILIWVWDSGLAETNSYHEENSKKWLRLQSLA